MVFVNEVGTTYYWLSVFKLGRDPFTKQEYALALMLAKTKNGQFQFEIDRFYVPHNFPQTELFEWEKVDVALIPRLSEIKNYPGFHYGVEDLKFLRDKFEINEF